MEHRLCGSEYRLTCYSSLTSRIVDDDDLMTSPARHDDVASWRHRDVASWRQLVLDTAAGETWNEASRRLFALMWQNDTVPQCTVIINHTQRRRGLKNRGQKLLFSDSCKFPTERTRDVCSTFQICRGL